MLRTSALITMTVAMLLFGIFGTTTYAQRRNTPSKRHGFTIVAYRADGQVIASGIGAKVRLKSVSNVVLAEFDNHPGTVTDIKFSPDGKLLAVACGLAGKSGEIWIWNISWVKLNALYAVKQMPWKLSGPTDLIYSLAFSPNGKYLAASCYDHDVSVWSLPASSVATKKTNLRTFRDHTDAVNAVSFSGDSTLLASAGSDRTVKIWDVASGKRLYTLNESTAELNSVAFRQDNQQVVAGGVDKTLRTWRINKVSGVLSRAALAHSGPILRVAYANGGASILTTSEDGTIKQWSSADLAEEHAYPKMKQWPTTISVDGRGKQAIAGTRDGEYFPIKISAASPIGVGNGGRQDDQKFVKKPIEQPLVSKAVAYKRPMAPTGATYLNASLGTVSPNGMQRGKTVRLTLSGDRISNSSAVFFDDPAISGIIVEPADPNGGVVRVDAIIGKNARIGVHSCYVQSPFGSTGAVPFAVGDWNVTAEVEPNNTLILAQKISTPTTIAGSLNSPGDVDCFKFDAQKGDEIVFEVIAQRIRSRLQPIVSVYDLTGTLLVEKRTVPGAPDVVVGYRFEKSGSYIVELKDFEGAGGGDVFYRFNIGKFPMVTHVSPAGIRAGTETDVRIEGFNLGGAKSVKIQSGQLGNWGATTTVQLPQLKEPIWLTRKIAVGADPEVIGNDDNTKLSRAQKVTVPVTVNGMLPCATRNGKLFGHYYRFHASRGVPLVIEVMAGRLGSPLDSSIEVVNSNGDPVESAVLRAVSQTESTLNDRDSSNPAMRLLTWDDFHLNDYIMIGRDIARVQTLPKGPDDDIFFRSFRGARLGYLGATPEFHSLGQSVYKVEVHPPGSKFSPNGYPLVHAYYKNDDGGPLYGRDSRIDFVAPADDDYFVRLSDARGTVSEGSFYRLAIHPPRRDFSVSISPSRPNIPRYGAALINVEAERYDGFDGQITVELKGLPAGFHATTAIIEAGETTATSVISASSEAVTPLAEATREIVVESTAIVNGKTVSHTLYPENSVRPITVLPPADLDVDVDRSVVKIRPGETTVMRAHVERRGSFGLRVPIEVKNLPFGVRVMNIGLNGVLVNETENEREFTLYCEPWVKAQNRLIYVTAGVEGGVPNVAPPVTLKIESPKSR